MLKRLALAILMLALGACASTPSAQKPNSVASVERPSFGKAYLKQADLQGKDARALDTLLGAPTLKRAEGKGEFRRYAFSSCSLIVILYPDEKGAARVQQLDATAKVSGEPKPDLDSCLARGPAQISTAPPTS